MRKIAHDDVLIDSQLRIYVCDLCSTSSCICTSASRRRPRGVVDGTQASRLVLWVTYQSRGQVQLGNGGNCKSGTTNRVDSASTCCIQRLALSRTRFMFAVLLLEKPSISSKSLGNGNIILALPSHRCQRSPSYNQSKLIHEITLKVAYT